MAFTRTKESRAWPGTRFSSVVAATGHAGLIRTVGGDALMLAGRRWPAHGRSKSDPWLPAGHRGPPSDVARGWHGPAARLLASPRPLTAATYA
jgi:hypothetical protein